MQSRIGDTRVSDTAGSILVSSGENSAVMAGVDSLLAHRLYTFTELPATALNTTLASALSGILFYILVH